MSCSRAMVHFVNCLTNTNGTHTNSIIHNIKMVLYTLMLLLHALTQWVHKVQTRIELFSILGSNGKIRLMTVLQLVFITIIKCLY